MLSVTRKRSHECTRRLKTTKARRCFCVHPVCNSVRPLPVYTGQIRRRPGDAGGLDSRATHLHHSFSEMCDLVEGDPFLRCSRSIGRRHRHRAFEIVSRPLAMRIERNHRRQRTPRVRPVCISRQWRGAAATDRSAKWQPLNLSTMAAKSQGGRSETRALAGFGL